MYKSHSEYASVVEYVEFAPLPGVSDSQVLEALRQTDPLLAELEGFEHRYLARHQHAWVEVVFWRDQQAADAGLAYFKTDSRSAELFSLIDPDSVSISYASLLN